MKVSRRATLLVVGMTVAALLVVLVGNVEPARGAPVLPESFTHSQVANGLVAPHDMEFAPDGRLFVAQQGGTVRIVGTDGSLSTFLDISDQVYQADSNGLLGVTLDPKFATNRYVYLFYTAKATGTSEIHNRIVRVKANASGDSAVPDSERTLLRLDDLIDNGFHNGGSIKFGSDGKLYATVGENNRRDPAQQMDSFFGKVVRINRDGAIPADNPFYSTATGDKKAIWAKGLRNPFKMAVQPGSGTIFINDVGGGKWEEINQGEAGANYGWPSCEGSECKEPPPPDHEPPVFAYPHDETQDPDNAAGCAIAGGTFYNPATAQFPSKYVGDYFFADWCNNMIRTYDPNTDQAKTFATEMEHAIDMEVDPDGSLYVLRRGAAVEKIRYTGSANRPPTAVVEADPSSGPTPLSVTFDGSQSSDPDSGDQISSYLWDFGDGSPKVRTDTPTTSHTYSTGGTYTASLRVKDEGGAESAPATVRIDAGNAAPEPEIESPAAGRLFRVGEQIVLTGSATDPEDGTLAEGSLSWEVLRHHNNSHTHPLFSGTGNDLTFSGPPPEGLSATGPGNFLEVRLTATDSKGLTETVTRNVQPHRVNVTFESNPDGLSLQADDQTFAAPETLVSWEGHTLSVDATSPQTLSGTTYGFTSWSDGGARQHNIVTGSSPSTYTATFEPDPDADNVAPSVSSTVPGKDATGVGRDTNVTATFSEPMNPATVTRSTFQLFKIRADGTTARVADAPVALSTGGLRATLDPFGDSATLLAQNTEYKAVVTTGAKDAAGNALDQISKTQGNQQKVWLFTTGSS